MPSGKLERRAIEARRRGRQGGSRRSTTRTVLLAVAVLPPVVLLLAGAGERAATAEAPRAKPGTDPQSSALARLEEEVTRRINEVRTGKGLEPLRCIPALARVARRHSADMAQHDFFGHGSSDGRSLFDRLKEGELGYSWAGENIYNAMGLAEDELATASVEGWMKSPGHRENILRPQFTEAGVGAWRVGKDYYLTQDFRKP